MWPNNHDDDTNLQMPVFDKLSNPSFFSRCFERSLFLVGSVRYRHPIGKDYKWYISGIYYCQLRDYMVPIPPIKGTRFHSIESTLSPHPNTGSNGFTTWMFRDVDRSTRNRFLKHTHLDVPFVRSYIWLPLRLI